MDTNRVEAVGATVASGAAVGASFVTQAHDWLVMLSAAASLAWWLRIWIRDINAKPPKA